ncbi:MAG: hypothetical protein Q8M66_03455 [Actinomycetota bacterium]|nr:hypothetical protein [Actinomycetota bacterium]MDZ4200965.1 hypothetical protein [Gallionella sp.]
MTPLALRKLQATSELLQQGLEIKPGKLNVLQQALDDAVARRDFLLFLLGVASRELPDIPLVLRCFSEVNELTASLDSPLTMQKLGIIADKLHAIQPWQKRLHVHATRRRAQYVDLYFLEMLVKGVTESRKGRSYYCLEAAKLFVFDYADMRYRVGDKTRPHWNAIVEYWQRQPC